MGYSLVKVGAVPNLVDKQELYSKDKKN